MQALSKSVGTSSTALLLQRIGAGEVPTDTVVREMGGAAWRWIGEIAAFKVALEEGQARRRIDSPGERIVLEFEPVRSRAAR